AQRSGDPRAAAGRVGWVAENVRAKAGDRFKAGHGGGEWEARGPPSRGPIRAWSWLRENGLTAAPGTGFRTGGPAQFKPAVWLSCPRQIGPKPANTSLVIAWERRRPVRDGLSVATHAWRRVPISGETGG